MNKTPSVLRTGGTSSTRYPSSGFGAVYVNNDGFVGFISAVSAGGNESWLATGTANAEI